MSKTLKLNYLSFRQFNVRVLVLRPPHYPTLTLWCHCHHHNPSAQSSNRNNNNNNNTVLQRTTFGEAEIIFQVLCINSNSNNNITITTITYYNLTLFKDSMKSTTVRILVADSGSWSLGFIRPAQRWSTAPLPTITITATTVSITLCLHHLIIQVSWNGFRPFSLKQINNNSCSSSPFTPIKVWRILMAPPTTISGVRLPFTRPVPRFHLATRNDEDLCTVTTIPTRQQTRTSPVLQEFRFLADVFT